MYDVCVVGLGYIGLPTASVIADQGLKVLGVDVNSNVVDTVNSGRIHIVEPGLEDLVRRNVKSGSLSASVTVRPAKTYIIAVPTPIAKDDFSPDISYVLEATRAISQSIKPGSLIILESTSPPGTTEKVAQILSELRADLDIPTSPLETANVHIAYCPERVLPGKTIEELRSNNRVVGGITPQCTENAINFYRKFVDGECIPVSSIRLAEICKLVENSFRDVNIAFANEISYLCHENNISSAELIRVANCHPRVNILQPGPGVGGHCIPVDPWFLVHAYPEITKLIKKSREINDSKPLWTVEKIKEFIADYITKSGLKAHPKVAIYGLSFKPNIDDLRESPALQVAEMLLNGYEGKIFLVEPNISQLPATLGTAQLVSLKEAMQDADLHVVLVGHDEFKVIKFDPTLTYFAVNF